MEKELFYYITAIIVPTLFTLYNIASIIYVVGEFKEHTLKVPKVLIILLIKLISLGILELHSFHYILHNFIPDNFYYISILINVYIMFEMYKINKLSFGYLKFIEIYKNKQIILYDENKFNKFVFKITKNYLSKNLFLFTFIEIFGIIIGSVLTIFTIFTITYFNFLLVIIYICIFITKRYLSNFMSTLN